MVDITIENLYKEFDTPSGKEVAVNSVDFEIKHGEFFTLVGPSGCGKTTTLRMIAGLEKPTSGDIYFDDEVVTDLSPQQRNISMVFQNISLYPHMTNYDNIGYGLRVRKKMENYDEKIQEVAEALDISELLDKKPPQLSGGQQQRVSLGRALVQDPNAILLDEPLSDLDAELKNKLRVLLQKIQKDFDVPMIYVTHDQEEALTMSDRLAVLRDGNIEQLSDPESVFNEPANEFVGGFIGQPPMNLVNGTLSEDGVLRLKNGPTDAVNHPGYDVVTQFNEIATGLSPGEYRVGFRPGEVTLTDDTKESIFPVTLEVLEPLGLHYIAYLQDEAGEEIRAITSDPPEKREGEQIGIRHIETLYVFDPGTGELATKLSVPSIDLRA